MQQNGSPVGGGSSHTLCQIPEDGLYEMPPGLRKCLLNCLPAAAAGSWSSVIILLHPPLYLY